MTFQHVFNVYPPGHQRVEEVRATFRSRMEKHYAGWDNAYDRQFDAHSFLFVLQDADAGEYLATCRIVFKHIRGKVWRTPIETAGVERFSLGSENVRCGEGGMVSFTSRLAALTLMYGVCSWLIDNEIDDLYTSHDVDNAFIKRLYTRDLGFVPVEGAVVRYENFCVRSTGQTAAWQVLRGNPVVTGPDVLARLVAQGVQEYPLPASTPRLADWL